MDTQISNKIKAITSVGEWKEVDGFPNYLVSTEGEVINKTTVKRMNQHVNHGGYKYVNLSHKGKAKQQLVHRLVATAFIPNPDNKAVVNHIDADRGNPKKSNLEWVTHKENSEHMVNSFRSPNQMMAILLNKKGEEIALFPSNKRCIEYIFNRYRMQHGYYEGEPIFEDIEFYEELSPVMRNGRAARRMKLNF
ncbi:NUMOD4 motif-containing HNH endonuclease [Halobacillus sp. A1]|uniref:NUMOD4 domain-containing protein n=1 Tax=Halobacillus sp. A1 TaxID=2880262 RepID=UPI0020A677AB|nr:NUMOD4 domain-containing protein [Halobacillus sp. A1]MCP3033588.1 NUMOD4 motif-containing HNH endonuclease [Halobacillus sp. A1]